MTHDKYGTPDVLQIKDVVLKDLLEPGWSRRSLADTFHCKKFPRRYGVSEKEHREGRHQRVVVKTRKSNGDRICGDGTGVIMRRGSFGATMPRDKVLEWLLEPNQPSIRWLTLTQVLGKSQTDSDVSDAKARIPTAGWAAEMLARRDPGGWWVKNAHPMNPNFIALNWNLLALSDLGATRAIPEVRASCELWMDKSPLKGGGVGGMIKGGKGHHCYTGNMARALIRFGYGDDRRVGKALDWLVKTAHPKGGWTCWNFGDGPSPGRTLDSWEGLSAFAAYPRSKWTRAMQSCIEGGAEFYLERELHRQGARYEPWYRFHWPVHYYYDLLVGLDVLTALGYGDDPRLGFALDLLRKKRRSDGRWNLDAVLPEPSPKADRWYAEHGGKRPTPLAFETAGRPSKMITLRALTVLSRVG